MKVQSGIVEMKGLAELARKLPDGVTHELRILMRRDGEQTTVHVPGEVRPIASSEYSLHPLARATPPSPQSSGMENACEQEEGA